MNDEITPQEWLAKMTTPMRDKVLQLQNTMRVMPQVQLETKHYYADGMYARVLFRTAGTLIVGKQHKKQHFYAVITGRVQVVGDVEVKEFGPGTVLVSEPGTKRAVLALEDSICMTVHRTNKKNLNKIEKELIEDDPQALFDERNELKIKELT